MDIITGKVIIDEIRLLNTPTSREVKIFSSKKQVICKYGDPSLVKDNSYIYRFKNKELIFKFKDSKVQKIHILNKS